MTYQDALKLRARMAYGQVKTAATGGSDYSSQVQDDTKYKEITGKHNPDIPAGRDAQRQEDYAAEQEAIQLQNAQNDALDQKAYEIYGPGSGVRGLTQEKEMVIADKLYKNRKAQDEADAAAAALRNRNIGIGAGALGGLGIGAGAYGLAGLFPSLKKRRLLRALIALGAGAAGGVGVGLGVNAGLNSGAIQGAYGATKGYLGGVGKALKGGK
jgi:hypothetical protein